MMKSSRWGVLVIVCAALLLTGCAHVVKTDADDEGGPANVEHLSGAEPARVTLTPSAMKRLDIQTDVVREVKVDGQLHVVVPYAAVLYDTEGDTWVYVNPSPGVFLRHPITIDQIAGDEAVLLGGLVAGVAVVSVGAEELYGSETEFEEE